MSVYRQLLSRAFWSRLAGITLGSICFSAGVALFLDPLHIAPGGLSGVAIVLNEFLPLETGAILMLLNVPLLVLGLWRFGREFLFSTVYATILSSALIDVITWLVQDLPLITRQELLASLVGSACTALGTGLVFRSGGTTGGVDIVIRLLRQRYPHIKSGTFSIALDAVVVGMVALVYRDPEKALIAAVGVVAYGIVLDRVLYQGDEATMLLIISQRSPEIAHRILTELDIGATFLPARGAYTGRPHDLLLCVAHKRLYPQIRQIVREEDSSAFTILTSASQVFGEGFKHPMTPDL